MLTIKQIRAIAKTRFAPRGRKFRVVEQLTYRMADYWDGGSREYAVAINLATGELGEPTAVAQNPFRGQAHAVLEIPEGVGVLTHQFCCGKDCGITLYVRPGQAQAWLPPSERVTVETRAVTIQDLANVKLRELGLTPANENV